MFCHAGCSKQSHLTTFTFSPLVRNTNPASGKNATQPETQFFLWGGGIRFRYLQSSTACLGAVCLTTRPRAVYSDVLSRTMSEIRSAAASSIHAARRSHSARQRYQTPRCRHSNRPTSANQNPSPPISPGNCRSAGAPVNAHAILFCIVKCAFTFTASCS